jgi:hypothetical protein
LSASLHPAAAPHVPVFIAAPGETDVLMVVMAVFLVLAVLAMGVLFLRLHSLPERMAHKGHKLQFEIVAVLGLLALLTHIHLFWVIGLLLALIDIPDFGTPLRRMANSLERLAGVPSGDLATHGTATSTGHAAAEGDEHISIIPETKPSPDRAQPALTPSGAKEMTHA